MGAGLSGDVISALAAPQNAQQATDPIWHVLNRVTNGPRPGQVDAVKKMGLSAYLEQQLAPEKIDDSASEAHLGDYATLDMSVTELLALGVQAQQPVQELDLGDGPPGDLQRASIVRGDGRFLVGALQHLARKRVG